MLLDSIFSLCVLGRGKCCYSPEGNIFLFPVIVRGLYANEASMRVGTAARLYFKMVMTSNLTDRSTASARPLNIYISDIYIQVPYAYYSVCKVR